MKKLIAFLFMTICVFMLSGCIFSTYKVNVGETVKPGVSQEQTVFDTVPDLTVACTDKSAKALKGTTTWTYTQDDGTKQSFCSDSMHPLQATEYMETLSLMPSTMSRYEPLMATLLFEAPAPDKVSVRCWDESCIDKPDSPAAEIEVQTIEVDFADGTWATDYTLTLLNGNYIYEVVAEWNTNENCEGIVHYSFRTSGFDMTIYPIDNIEDV